jgi:hypothetical protein
MMSRANWARIPLALLILLFAGFVLSSGVCGGVVKASGPAGPGSLITAVSRAAAAGRDGSDVARIPTPLASTAFGADPSGEEFVPAADVEAIGGSLQVHNVTVWDGFEEKPHMHVSFAPVSLEQFFGNVTFRTTVIGGEEVEVADVAPALDVQHVEVKVDGRATSVDSIHWYYAGYSDLGGADTKYMPICLVRVERPALESGTHTIRVEIEDVRTGATGTGETAFDCSPWNLGI